MANNNTTDNVLASLERWAEKHPSDAEGQGIDSDSIYMLSAAIRAEKTRVDDLSSRVGVLMQERDHWMGEAEKAAARNIELRSLLKEALGALKLVDYSEEAVSDKDSLRRLNANMVATARAMLFKVKAAGFEP